MNELWCGEFLLKNQQHQRNLHHNSNSSPEFYRNRLALRARWFPKLEVRIMVANMLKMT